MSKYNYTDIGMYWDSVFDGVPKYTVDTKIPYPEIIDGIKWLGENADHVLDFGCGNGKALVVSAKLGVKSGVGVDVSARGIEKANEVVKNTKIEDSFKFLQGGIEALSEMDTDTFDGAILFNILDNLHPEDAKLLIVELGRVLKKGAAVIIKLNPVYEESVFADDDEFRKVADDCYEEESGLLFWNMDEAVINDVLDGHFEYVDGYDIDMTDFDTVNRMYWLKKI